ncbi:MAG: acyltransferase [Acidimicrobiales bacterium]
MSQPEARHLPALDGLRAVAVAAVVAFHLGRLQGGFLGVDVFFVVSGFLITRLLLAEWEERGRIDGRAFWARRFRRLVPALLAVLAAVAVASRAWLPAWRLAGVRDDAGRPRVRRQLAVHRLGAVVLRPGHRSQPAPPHVVARDRGAVLRLVAPRRAGRAGAGPSTGRERPPVVGAVAGAGAIASATWMAVAAGRVDDLSRVYYGTDTRAFALLAGAWLATWWDPAVARAGRRRRTARQWRESWSAGGAVGLAALAVLAVSVREDELVAYRGGFQVAAALSVVAVAGLAVGHGAVARVLARPVPTWIGRRSYGIYLWSWPVQVFAVEQFGLRGWSLDAVVVAVTLGLATASYRWIEAPVLARRTPTPALAGHEAPAEPGAPEPGVSEPEAAAVVAPATVVPRFAWAGVGGPTRRAAAGGLAVAAVVGLVVGVAAGAPPEPELLRVTDREVASVALAPSSGFGELGPTSSTTAPPTTAAPSTTAPGPSARALVGVAPDPTEAPRVLPPGPFATTGDVVVRTPAPDGTAALAGPCG